MRGGRSAMLFCLLVVASGMPGAAASNTVLIPRDNSGQRLPVFSAGYTIFFDRTAATIWSYDRAGTLRTHVTLSLPEAAQVSITEVAAARDGRLVAAGSVTSSEGQKAGAIFWIDVQGKLERVVRTTPFFSTRLAFGPRDLLWAAGRVTDAGFRETPQHEVIRQFDQEGKEVRATTPRDSFSSGRHPCSRCFLAANSTTIGFYSDSTNEYVELDSSGSQTGRWKTAPLPESVDLVGSALTTSGDFYLGGGTTNAGGFKTLLYRLNKATGAFVPVDVPADTGSTRALTLIGADGDRLVIYGKPASITWLKVN